MSLLSSFSDDFNRSMRIFIAHEEISPIGQRRKKYQESWLIIGLLLPTKASYNQFSSNKQAGNNGTLYDKYEYSFRCEFGVDLKKGDILQDQFEKTYEIKRALRSPWFEWDDHLVCYIDECDGIPN